MAPRFSKDTGEKPEKSVTVVKTNHIVPLQQANWEAGTDEFRSIKLHMKSNPAEPLSPTYQQFCYIFESGTPEQWLN